MTYFDPKKTRIIQFDSQEEAMAFALPTKHGITHNDPEIQLRKRIVSAIVNIPTFSCDYQTRAALHAACEKVWETE